MLVVTLDAENYASWSTDVKYLLIGRGLWGAIARDFLENDEAKSLTGWTSEPRLLLAFIEAVTASLLETSWMLRLEAEIAFSDCASMEAARHTTVIAGATPSLLMRVRCAGTVASLGT